MAAKSVKIKRIKYHNEGFNKYRQTAPVSFLVDAGERIAEEATAASGGEHVVIVSETKSRARVVVITADDRAREAEATDRTLTNALDAGRG